MGEKEADEFLQGLQPATFEGLQGPLLEKSVADILGRNRERLERLAERLKPLVDSEAMPEYNQLIVAYALYGHRLTQEIRNAVGEAEERRDMADNRPYSRTPE